MKIIYKKPLIIIEELNKKDVLCSSPPTDPDKFDNAVSNGEGFGKNDLGDLSNVI